MVSKATKGPWDPLSTVVKSGTFSFGIVQWDAIRWTHLCSANQQLSRPQSTLFFRKPKMGGHLFTHLPWAYL